MAHDLDLVVTQALERGRVGVAGDGGEVEAAWADLSDPEHQDIYGQVGIRSAWIINALSGTDDMNIAAFRMFSL